MAAVPDYYLVGPNLVLESSVPSFDPQNGVKWKEVYAGPLDQVLGLTTLFGLDMTYTIDESERPLYRITLTTPDRINGAVDAQNRWEMLSSHAEKDIREHPLFKVAVTQSEQDDIAKMIKNNKALSDTDISLSNEGAVLYHLMTKGQNKTLGWERTFRYTVTVSNRYGVLVSEFGINRLWTTGALLNPIKSGLVIPSGILFDIAAIKLPYEGLLGNPITETVSCGGGSGGATVTMAWYWSWLKAAPNVQQLPNGKVEITQEWLLDYWSAYNATLGHKGEYLFQA